MWRSIQTDRTIKSMILLSLSILFSLTGQPCATATKFDKTKSRIQSDTSIIATIDYTKDLYWIFNDAKPSNLRNEEYRLIDTLLIECINSYNALQIKRFEFENARHPEYHLDRKDFVIDLTNYKRQYVIVTTPNKDKQVWINCFCSTDGNSWKKAIVRVRDGGNCYFNLKVNLTRKRYYDLTVNGEA